MAKVSARGACKLMQANREWTDTDGWDHKLRYALRSDGKVLRAHDIRSPERRESSGARGWSRGSYSIVASMESPILNSFKNYAARLGLTVTA